MSRVFGSFAPAAGAFLLTAASTLALAGSSVATPIAAPAATAAAITAATAAKANPQDKMICKSQTPIGSRLRGHKVCLKKSDWEAQSREAQDTMDQRVGSPTYIK